MVVSKDRKPHHAVSLHPCHPFIQRPVQLLPAITMEFGAGKSHPQEALLRFNSCLEQGEALGPRAEYQLLPAAEILVLALPLHLL